MKFLGRFRTVLISGALAPGVLLQPVMTGRETSDGFVGKKPSVVLQASKTSITYPCPQGMYSLARSCPTKVDMQVLLKAVAKNFSRPTFAYNVGGGRIIGEGSDVIWDLYDAGPGFYRAIVEVQDNSRHRAVSSVDVKVLACADCVPYEPCFYPIVVKCYDRVNAGTPITCNVVVQSQSGPGPFTFEWSARDSSGGDLTERISARGSYVSIPTEGLGGQTVTATVEIKGLDPSCSHTYSGVSVVK